MDLAILNRHIIAIAHKPDKLPPDELISYASERDWLNVSRTNAAFNISSGGHTGGTRRVIFEINLLIVSGFLRSLFPSGHAAE